MNPSPPHDTPRVAFYSRGWPPGHAPSGIASYVSNLRRGLQALGAESLVLASTIAPGQVDPSLVRVLDREHLPLLARFWEKMSARLRPGDGIRHALARSISHALTLLQRTRPVDLIEVEESFGFAGLLQRRVRIPTVVRLHGPWFLVGQTWDSSHDPTSGRRIAHEGQAIRNAIAVSAPSATVLRQVSEHYGVALENAVVIPNPGPEVAEADTWNASRCERESILFVGRFDTLKGGDLAITAFARLAQKRPHARLVFVGPDNGVQVGSGQPRGFDAFVADTISDPGIRARVQFLGPRPPDMIAGLRRSAAVTIVCSRYETFPLTVIEAMAFGCPLVAAGVGGIPELVGDHRNARLVPRADASLLAEAIESLLDKPEEAARLGAAARQEYLKHFAPVAVARRMLPFYESVVSRWRSTRRKT